ncbi:hypothetical protein JCGZ_22310 [Jatropha curcas]|uniref:Alpha/beta hydrolase fold-3 domain-containing protein n=1 Tax=Jatropha curcas TaxID=180498 RepID=A0A067JQR7_JATCU|nr:hypothetical protein JCGZ_22310 [Jatropha curcas]
MYYHFYARLVRSAKVVCVSVFLRRAPEHRLPASSDDAYTAFLWLRAVARGELQEPWLEGCGDFRRVFLVGDRTGIYLVHQVAAREGAEDVEPVKIAGGVPIHPGFQRAKPSKSFSELPDNPLLTREMVNKFMSLALPIGSTKDQPITCPVGPQAPPLESLSLPPMLVVVAEMDLLRDTDLEYCEATKEAGKEVEVLINEGMDHCFYLNKAAIDSDVETAAQVDKLIEEIVSFINGH